LRVQG
jgi:THO complex subunit 2